MAQRGALFLGEKLALLRSLGDIDDSKEKKRKSKSLDQPTVKSLASLLGKDEEKQAGETTSKLAVLLEFVVFFLAFCHVLQADLTLQTRIACTRLR